MRYLSVLTKKSEAQQQWANADISIKSWKKGTYLITYWGNSKMGSTPMKSGENLDEELDSRQMRDRIYNLGMKTFQGEDAGHIYGKVSKGEMISGVRVPFSNQKALAEHLDSLRKG